MTANINLPSAAADLTPILVSGPVARTGSTLLQRLICSAENGICYGENIFGEILETATAVMSRLQIHAQLQDSEKQALENVLGGRTDLWIPHLSPEYSGYMNAILSQFYVLPTHTQHYSSVIGRPHWGMKRPACDLSTLRMLRSLMPSARTVYIYRNIFDCIRSAKARQFVASTDDIREMVLDWRNNIIDIEQADAEDKIILIKYEDLTANPESQLARLEKETGLRGIDRGVMAVKVNTWTGSDSGKGLAPDQYIPPAEIDEAERTLIRETAGDLLVRLYPGA